MNKAILMGRFTRDPEIRFSQTENASAVAKFTLAVDRRFKRPGDTQEADFISCVAFGKQAEFIGKYFHQGMKALIDGRIQTGSYINKENQKIYTTDLVIENIEFIESKGNGLNNNSKGSALDQNTPDGDGFMNIPDGIDEELPFS